MRTTAHMNFSERWCRLGAASMFLMLASGCTALRTATTTPALPSFYSLDNARSAAPAAPRALPTAAPTLVVSAPRAAAGFDSQRIIYVRQPHKLEYFAHSEWIDTPARMLSPLVVAAVENSGAFRAVVQAPSSASGELRLDTEVLQLQHEFEGQPSRVRFVLRAHLVEDATRRVIASRELEAVATAPSEDPYGGVVAANQAVQTVLENLATFCAEAAENWRPKSP
jgi:cholesterol transport system auxiliary component